VLLGFTLLVIITGSFGTVSYQYLREVERKQRFVEVADGLRDSILESRRYEKNFLLYGSGEDLSENRRFSQLGIDLAEKTIPEIKDFQGVFLLNKIKSELDSYRLLMERIAPERGNNSGLPLAEEQFREHGKALIDLSQSLVYLERERILQNEVHDSLSG
jgi:hypothetical protein